MPMSLVYASAIAGARSCLAALADSAPTFEESVRYEQLLLDLDQILPFGPALYRATGTKAELLGRLEAAVDRMLDLGGDGLSLELLLDSAIFGAARPACRSQQLESADGPTFTPRRQP